MLIAEYKIQVEGPDGLTDDELDELADDVEISLDIVGLEDALRDKLEQAAPKATLRVI